VEADAGVAQNVRDPLVGRHTAVLTWTQTHTQTDVVFEVRVVGSVVESGDDCGKWDSRLVEFTEHIESRDGLLQEADAVVVTNADVNASGQLVMDKIVVNDLDAMRLIAAGVDPAQSGDGMRKHDALLYLQHMQGGLITSGRLIIVGQSVTDAGDAFEQDVEVATIGAFQ
jgi:hypothetical protein